METGVWTTAEIVVGLSLSALYVFTPRALLHVQGASPPSDGAHYHVIRTLVCVWLSSNFKLLLLKKRRDCAARSAQATSKLIAFLAILLNAFHGNCMSKLYGDKLPLVDIASCLFFILSSLSHVSFTKTTAAAVVELNRLLTDPQSLTLHIDFLATCVFGLLWLACPDWLLGFQTDEPEDDAFHLHLIRAFGAMMIGDGFVALAAQNLKTKQDEPPIFAGRVLGTTVLFLLMIYTLTTTSTWRGIHVWFGLVGAGVWTGNSVQGYLELKKRAGIWDVTKSK
ncbi:uncharacterized protein LOC120536053 [Polypterus senegalus]|uniref:uncharacterized protein LOC120536053 n=1 Tax=Polypterus senegalus TaxID=55291 RepID=UPI001966053E|nr:uncharacterized protein LOC120536053 [Polypterus senegalus]